MRWAVVMIACTPAPGLHLTETPETLARGAMSISVAGGAGAAKETNHCCVAGAVRVRYGLAGDQEIGVQGSYIHASGESDESGELQWKASGSARRAVELGVGVAHFGGVSVGGDASVLGATDAPRRWQLYGALRATVSEPVSGDVEPLGPTFGVVVPVGVAIDLVPMLQLFVEGGGLVGATSGSHWIGGYGGLALTLRP